jgi:hypothetical protein
MASCEDVVVDVVERSYNGVLYRVTITEHRQVMPWGTEPCCFSTAKWERLGRTQMQLFDD